ncbi:MAG TPA: tetratricopeptide repeat protein [Burkholderiales bacterium]
MAIVDVRSCPVTGASRRALEHFERALEAFQLSRGDPLAHLRAAVAEAPGFAMARLFEAHLRLGGRDPAGTGAAALLLEEITPGGLNSRERGHCAALAAAVAGEYEVAAGVLGDVLREYPRDVLALQVAHSFDYVRGDTRALRDRVESVMPAWSEGVPGYDSVLSMLAFGLEECGEYGRAEETALRALALEPRSIRAHHAVAHVLEMQGRAREGARWMRMREAFWAGAGSMETHNWWHFALFELEVEGERRALEIYDRHIGAAPRAISDLIDASALLWRLHLRGMGLDGRWRALAERWAPHAEDAYCAFNDLHAMMTFAGAQRWDLAHALLAAQSRRILQRGSNSEMTRLVGLPACRALNAFGRGDYATAENLLSRLPPSAHRVGGSHAQRDVFELTRAAAQTLASPRPRESLRAA